VRDAILGGMAYEVDSQALERLRGLYAEMSDGELTALAENPDDLTEMAQQVLRNELGSRKLPVAKANGGSGFERRWATDAFAGSSTMVATNPVAQVILGSAPEVSAEVTEGRDLAPGEFLLRTFHDSFEMAKACESLERAAIGFRVEDVSQASDTSNGYAPVALNLVVAKQDREQAMTVLRKEMGLFPLQEVSEPDAMVDDGTVAQVGYFGRRQDADEIAQVLEEAGIWHRVAANPEGSSEAEDAWVVEVKEIDLMRAGDVVEKALG